VDGVEQIEASITMAEQAESSISTSPQKSSTQALSKTGISEGTRRQSFTVGAVTWEHTMTISGSVLEVTSKENGESAFSKIDLSDRSITKAGARFSHGSGLDEEWTVTIYPDHWDFIHFSSETDARRAEKEIQALIDAQKGLPMQANVSSRASPNQTPQPPQGQRGVGAPGLAERDRFAERAMLLSEQSNWKECLREAQKMIAAYPNFGAAWEGSAEARRELGDLNGALADAKKAVSIEETDAAYAQLAYTQRDRGNLREAIRAMDRAIELTVANDYRRNLYQRSRSIWAKRLR